MLITVFIFINLLYLFILILEKYKKLYKNVNKIKYIN